MPPTHPPHLSFPAHNDSVITTLLFHNGRIVTASDDHNITVHDPSSGKPLHTLKGHEGGVWALAASTHQGKDNMSTDTLVSGSTDRTLRVWDLTTGRATHVFAAHTSTVRALAIVHPEWVDVDVGDGTTRREKWPKRRVIVSGSRDHHVRVWTLPRVGEEEEYKSDQNDDDEYKYDSNRDENPYHRLDLTGHTNAVRSISAQGRTAVSSSYDQTVRVWDIISGQCKWVLAGHTGKVYSAVLDLKRNRVYSGSMDYTIRIWDLQTGTCLDILTAHDSLVGLLQLSPSFLVSGCADATLCVWDPDSGTLLHKLTAQTGAITCLDCNDAQVVSGSNEGLLVYGLVNGAVERVLLDSVTGVWQAVMHGRWCVAASSVRDETWLHVWDFGDDREWMAGVNSVESDGERVDEDEDDPQASRIKSLVAEIPL